VLFLPAGSYTASSEPPRVHRGAHAPTAGRAESTLREFLLRAAVACYPRLRGGGGGGLPPLSCLKGAPAMTGRAEQAAALAGRAGRLVDAGLNKASATRFLAAERPGVIPDYLAPAHGDTGVDRGGRACGSGPAPFGRACRPGREGLAAAFDWLASEASPKPDSDEPDETPFPRFIHLRAPAVYAPRCHPPAAGDAVARSPVTRQRLVHRNLRAHGRRPRPSLRRSKPGPALSQPTAPSGPAVIPMHLLAAKGGRLSRAARALPPGRYRRRCDGPWF